VPTSRLVNLVGVPLIDPDLLLGQLSKICSSPCLPFPRLTVTLS
jgi:hypothetical protein